MNLQTAERRTPETYIAPRQRQLGRFAAWAYDVANDLTGLHTRRMNRYSDRLLQPEYAETTVGRLARLMNDLADRHQVAPKNISPWIRDGKATGERRSLGFSNWTGNISVQRTTAMGYKSGQDAGRRGDIFRLKWGACEFVLRATSDTDFTLSREVNGREATGPAALHELNAALDLISPYELEPTQQQTGITITMYPAK